MLDCLDIVRAKRTLSHVCAVSGKEVVPAGATGTIMMVHDERVGYKLKPGELTHFEVEFAEEDGTTIAIMTVSEEDIELVESYPPSGSA